MSNSEPSSALKSKIRRLHSILDNMAVTGDDRDKIKQAVDFIDSAQCALKKDPTDASAALHWCQQAEPYILLKNQYLTLGNESPHRTVERASNLLCEILGKPAKFAS